MRRREFLRLLALAAAAGAGLRPGSGEAQAAAELYDVPPFGNVSFLHLTDVHGQLLPVYFREPSVNLGSGKPPHLVGEALLREYQLPRGNPLAHAFTLLDFENAARRYGKIYNAKAYNLCSQMPRLGLSGTLTEEQIKDLVALLLDLDSPVNQ